METMIVSPYSKLVEHISATSDIIVKPIAHDSMQLFYGCHGVAQPSEKRIMHTDRLQDPVLTTVIAHEWGHTLQYRENSQMLLQYRGWLTLSEVNQVLDSRVLAVEEDAWKRGLDCVTSLGLIDLLPCWSEFQEACLDTYRTAFTPAWKAAQLYLDNCIWTTVSGVQSERYR